MGTIPSCGENVPVPECVPGESHLRRLGASDISVLEAFVDSVGFNSCLFESYSRKRVLASLAHPGTAWYGDANGYVRFVEGTARHVPRRSGVSRDWFSVWLLDCVRGASAGAKADEASKLHYESVGGMQLLPTWSPLAKRMSSTSESSIVRLRLEPLDAPIAKSWYPTSKIGEFYALMER